MSVERYKQTERNGKSVRMHRVIAERALGKPLPRGAVVHHHDGDRKLNDGTLVICENQAYHMLIERRTRALAACGHAHWRQCYGCRDYDDPAHLNMDRWGRVYHYRGRGRWSPKCKRVA